MNAVLEFESGASGTLLLTFDSASHRGGSMELLGTRGTLRTPDPNAHQAAGRTVAGIGALKRITARKFEVRPQYEIRTGVSAFDDPDVVLARLHLLFDTPEVEGETHIWCIFHFDRDGKVVEVEEMLDTSSGVEVPQ